jgi:tetratricopeptide (TPR) repeat protein
MPMKWWLQKSGESRTSGNAGSWGRIMRRIVAANLVIFLGSLALGAGAGWAAAAKAAKGEFNLNQALLQSYNLIDKQQYKKAEALLAQVLAKDPGNPLALSDKAAIFAAQKKFKQAEAYLQKALPRAKGYLVQADKTCPVGKICLAFKPAAQGTASQDLGSLLKTNMEMIKFLAAAPPPKKQ